MDRRSKATVVLRLGTVLVAIALAFGLISYLSSLTVSGYHGDQCFNNFGPYNCSNLAVVPAGTYTVLFSWDPGSPQQMYFLNMSSTPVEAEVYLLNANQTTFDSWAANRSGLPLSNFTQSSNHPLSLFSEYLSEHGQEVAGRFNVSSAIFVVRYFLHDVEPLMAVVTDGDGQRPLNFTYFATGVGVMINPAVGYQAAGYAGAPGALLAAAGFVLKRRHRG
jgi:hypothetical protein